MQSPSYDKGLLASRLTSMRLLSYNYYNAYYVYAYQKNITLKSVYPVFILSPAIKILVFEIKIPLKVVRVTKISYYLLLQIKILSLSTTFTIGKIRAFPPVILKNPLTSYILCSPHSVKTINFELLLYGSICILLVKYTCTVS